VIHLDTSKLGFSPQAAAIYEYERATKQEYLNDAIDGGDLDQAAVLAGSTWGPQLVAYLLQEEYGRHPKFPAVLAHVWIMNHAPLVSMRAMSWRKAFQAAGFVSDTDGRRPPDQAMRVYRGGRDMADWNGMSWTTDLEIENRFRGMRCGGQYTGGYVCETIVDPHHVLALFDSRNESEVVVDPYWISRNRTVRAIHC
jgi:hypothetical protein